MMIKVVMLILFIIHVVIEVKMFVGEQMQDVLDVQNIMQMVLKLHILIHIAVQMVVH